MFVFFFQVKILLFQRRQIPEQVDELKRVTSSVERDDASHSDAGDSDTRIQRNEQRRRRQELRHVSIVSALLSDSVANVMMITISK
jgi:hypothetical protein